MSEEQTYEEAVADEPVANEAVVADEAVVTEESPQPQPTAKPRNNENRGEWINFGILVVILVGTVLVIYLLNPIIFGKIVPAVMGEGYTTTAPMPADTVKENSDDPAVPSNTDTTATEGEEATTGTGGTGEETGETATESDDPNVGGGAPADNPAPVEQPAENTTVEEPAPAESETEARDGEAAASEAGNIATENIVLHTVQPGETLSSIARNYNVPVQVILDANTIPNPDNILVNTILRIPQ